MQRRNRFIRQKKYPGRQIIRTNDPETCQAFYQATDAHAPLEPGQYAAGIIQHPLTKYYQVWVSTNGLDINYLCTQRLSTQAKARLQEIGTFLHDGGVYDDKKTIALLRKLKQESDSEPQALPDHLVRQITRGILRAVVCRSPQPEIRSTKEDFSS